MQIIFAFLAIVAAGIMVCLNLTRPNSKNDDTGTGISTGGMNQTEIN